MRDQLSCIRAANKLASVQLFRLAESGVEDHIENTEIHIDNEERSKWNEKVTIRINEAIGMLIVEN